MKVNKDKYKEKKINSTNIEKNNFDDQVEGRNPVLELLESGKDINKIFITRGEKHGSINKIIAMAKERRIIIVEKDKRQMDEIAQTRNYQGVIAQVPPFAYCEVEDILENAKSKKEDPFVIILDGIEDPHNLGAIIRTAAASSFDGIIIPKDREVGVTSTVVKASVGTIFDMDVVQVTNIKNTIEELKKEGFWIVGTSMNGSDYRQIDYSGKIALVIGNEGKGMSKLVTDSCDFLASIPIASNVESLNASVAAGIMMYEVVRNRK